jgi:TolB-like protein/Flp pilus assembly protein TadD
VLGAVIATLGHYKLTLMGPFRLLDPQGERVAVTSRRAMALIAMLAMSAEGERSRGWLQEKLWGAREDRQAAGSLRRELSELRRLLNTQDAPLLLTQRDRVRLDLSMLCVDAHAPVGGAGPTAHAAEDFLEGLDLSGEEGFEDWRRERRLALRPRMRQPDGPEPAPRSPGDLDELSLGEPDGWRAASIIEADHRPFVVIAAFRPGPRPQETAFAEALASDLVAALAKSRLLAVRSSHPDVPDEPLHPARLRPHLGADYLVQGHIRRLGSDLRVLITLSSTVNDRALWSAHYDHAASEGLAVQEKMLAAIVGGIEPALLDHEASRSLNGQNGASDHWSLFLRGRWRFWRAKAEDFETALSLLAEARRLRPDDVPTITLQALCHLGQAWTGVTGDPRHSVLQAYDLMARAVALDPGDAYAHCVHGMVLSFMGRPDQALAEQRFALDLNPYLAAAAGEMGRLSLLSNHLQEAMEWSDTAIASAPGDPHAFLWFRTKAFVSFIRRQYDAAARHAADACARSPHQFFLHYLLAACRAAAGRRLDARSAFAEGRRLLPTYNEQMIRLGLPFTDEATVQLYMKALRSAGWRG